MNVGLCPWINESCFQRTYARASWMNSLWRNSLAIGYLVTWKTVALKITGYQGPSPSTKILTLSQGLCMSWRSCYLHINVINSDGDIEQILSLIESSSSETQILIGICWETLGKVQIPKSHCKLQITRSLAWEPGLLTALWLILLQPVYVDLQALIFSVCLITEERQRHAYSLSINMAWTF
jgi:hypothetical protein